MIKKYAGLLLGLVFGILITLACLLIISPKADAISLISIIVNGILLLLIAKYFTRGENSTSALKTYFTSELIDLRSKYFQYLAEVEQGSISKSDVISLSKNFSVEIQQLKTILKKEFDINTEIEKVLSGVLFIISGNSQQLEDSSINYFDRIRDTELITLSRDQSRLLSDQKKDLNLLFKFLVIEITKN